MGTRWRRTGEEDRSCGTAGMTMSEADVVELCNLGLPRLRSMVRPDTNRVGEAFDDMMAGVKRRSQTRHMDMDKAVEWCFATFAGRGNRSISVREFAERLSVFSIKWSGDFSPEDCLALAETLGEEDDPDLITIGSFSSAVNVGSRVDGTSRNELRSCSSRMRYRTGDRQERGNNSSSSETWAADNEAANASEDPGSRATSGEDADGQSGTGFDAIELGDDGEEFGRRGGNCCSGQTAASWEATLKRAVAEARLEGTNVWALLDSTTKKATKRPRDTARGSIFPGSASATTLTSEMLHRFLTKLDICLLPSSVPDLLEAKSPPPPPPPPIPTTADEQDDEKRNESLNEAARQPSSRIQKGVDVRDSECLGRVGGGGEGLAMGTSKHCDRSRSNSETTPVARGRGRGRIGGSMAEGSPAASDRYLRQLSRDSASLRCRVQQYNGELARTTREAENLLSSARNKNPHFRSSSSPSSSVSDAGGLGGRDVDGRERGVSRGGVFFYAEERSTVIDQNYRSSSAATGGERVSVKGGGPPCLVAEVPAGNERATTIRRVTPLERPDPSHPRVEILGGSPLGLILRSGSKFPQSPFSPAVPIPSPHLADAQRSAWLSGAGDFPRGSSSSAAQKDRERKAALLLAILGRRDGKEDAEPVSPTASERTRLLFSTAYVDPAPTRAQEAVVTCFDPPTVRNGLAGLTMKQVDSVLLRVEGATPGSQSCWKPIEKRASYLEHNQQHQQHQRYPQRGTVGRERRWPGRLSPASLSRETRRWVGARQMKRIAPGNEEDEEEEEEEEEEEYRGASGTVIGGAVKRSGAKVKRASALGSKTGNTWEQMKRVIKMPRSAKPLPWERRNMWDTARMQRVNRDYRHSEFLKEGLRSPHRQLPPPEKV